MEADINAVLVALSKKLQLFQDIKTISIKQLEFIIAFDVDRGSFEPWEDYYNSREKLMLKANALEEKINHYRKDAGINDLTDGQIQEKIMPEHYQAYLQYSEEIAGIISNILANDQKAMDFMKVLLGQTGTKLNRARVQKKAVNAYTQYEGNSEAWFFDKKK